MSFDGESGSRTERSWLACASQASVVLRSLRVAIVVGTLLVVINQGDRLLHGPLGPVEWLKIALTYCVPYAVATYAAVQATRKG